MLDAKGNLKGHTHPPNFGKRVVGCGRCGELAGGAAPRVAPSWVEAAKRTKIAEARLSEAIRLHDCRKSNCGVVCTAFDW